jgi:predicted nucleic acid-binding protein
MDKTYTEQGLDKNFLIEYTIKMKNKCRIYLDNCSFNRPYDDQSVLKNYLEAEAKLYIQNEIRNNTFELAWSYMLDYEISFNPFDDRKTQILKWKNSAVIDIDYSENNVKIANDIRRKNIHVRVKDSIHLACSIEAKCNYFITTDGKLLSKVVDNITIINPLNFIQQLGV